MPTRSPDEERQHGARRNGRFQLGVLGLNRLQRMMIESVCALTQSRLRGYALLPDDRCPEEAHITVVDADDAVAYLQWHHSQACRTGRPAVMLTANTSDLRDAPYRVPRNHFASRLLKTLDQITIREFKYLPEFVVGEQEAALDTEALIRRSGVPVPANAPRVLVIDDSLVIRTRLEVVLRLSGFEADLVADAEEALGLVERKHYAVVLLDVMLPGIDGFAACRSLRTSTGDPSLPIVMLTSKNSRLDRVRGLLAGCTRYLTKPVNAEELRKLLIELTTGSA